MPNAIAVTAHYDDAVLFAGGTILRTRALGWNWTIVAMCNQGDPQKAKYFSDYCLSVGATPCLMDFIDDQGCKPFSRNNEQRMVSDLRCIASSGSFDYVFTHSRDPNGEYGGHGNHDEVREVAKSVFASNKLLSFSYSPIYKAGGTACAALLDSNYLVQLTYSELLEKCLWCQKTESFDGSLPAIAYPCPNPEAFKGQVAGLPRDFIKFG